MQCAAGAMTAAAGATGARAWLATKAFSWMTPRRMRLASFSLVGTGVLAAALGLSAA